MLTLLTIYYSRALAVLFYLTDRRWGVNNVSNMPTKPLPSMLKLCGLFYASNLEAL